MVSINSKQYGTNIEFGAGTPQQEHFRNSQEFEK